MWFYEALVASRDTVVSSVQSNALLIGLAVAGLMIVGGLTVFFARLRAHLKDKRSLPQGNQRTKYGIQLERELHMTEEEGSPK